MQTSQELSSDERVAWLRLIRSENVGPITFFQLLNRYGSASKSLETLPDLARKGGRKKPIRIFPLSLAKKEIENLHNFGAELIAACEPDYPARLRMIADPPPVIAIRGHRQLLSRNMMAIVGARNASAVAMRLTENIARELCQANIVITSGLARGIDTSAHQASLDAGTVAVVGGGVDYFYPRENTELQNSIFDRGCVVAEQSIGTVPQARHFPRRNRIISGMSLGVLVVEASPKSGSLITARMALEQDRDVFAVPGSPMDPRSRGTNNLIRSGAVLVESADDILAVLQTAMRRPLEEPDQPPLPFHQPLIPDEQELTKARPKIISLLCPTPVEIDEIIRLTQMPPAIVLTILLELELAGRIERHFGNRVSIIE
ncbi:MAG: DNA-processing protein DprA [Proteobacteria bacterium]|nr:DNA-processing protein DprA [Pseudomonadota bacterium]